MWDFLGKLLIAALLGGGLALTAYVVKGIIDKSKIQQAMRDKEIEDAIIETVSRSARRVKLKDIKRGSMLEIEGDGISDDIYEGMRISA